MGDSGQADRHINGPVSGLEVTRYAGKRTFARLRRRSRSRQRAAAVHGPVAGIHFDAHLDTWDTHFGNPYTHGNVLRRALEEGLARKGQSAHVGCRGSPYSGGDLRQDENLGFVVMAMEDLLSQDVDSLADRIRETTGDAPVYVSIDIDVLDPAFASATVVTELCGLFARRVAAPSTDGGT